MSKKPVYVLGTGLSHDGSSCLMKDGEILVAIEKERLTRVRHDGFNDNASIQYCLDVAGIGLEDVDLIVEKSSFNPLKPEDATLRAGRILPDSAPVVRMPHHLAHAYSAIGTSPFESAGVVVLDGQGTSLDNCTDVPPEALPEPIRKLALQEHYLYWEKESYYVFQDGRIQPVFRDFSHWLKWDRDRYPAAPFDMEHSIGEFYGGVACYVFGHQWCEGKLMGLAPYGRPGRFTSLPAFELSGPRAFMRTEWMEELPREKAGRFAGNRGDFQFYADLARWAQDQLESVILYLFRRYHELSPQADVAYAGGVALNAVTNGRLSREGPFRRLYVQPAAGDNGLALGCCFYGWCEVLGNERLTHSNRTWFGQSYGPPSVEEALAPYPDELVVEHRHDSVSLTARFLSEGKVVGWFQDGSEFGPRALGNRSILADPRRREMQEHINRDIKFREDFRPFAPIVLAEDTATYFEQETHSPHMTTVATVQEKWRKLMPAVVHVDGSARLQTVSRSLRPKLHALLVEFKRLSGLGVLLNTSLNTRGEPIVERPGDALRVLLETGLDVLVIQDWIVTKRKQ